MEQDDFSDIENIRVLPDEADARAEPPVTPDVVPTGAESGAHLVPDRAPAAPAPPAPTPAPVVVAPVAAPMMNKKLI